VPAGCAGSHMPLDFWGGKINKTKEKMKIYDILKVKAKNI
jgi:hypothetical protein